MNKTLTYLGILLILTLVAYFAFFNQTTNTLDDASAGFAVEDTAVIQRIKITDREGLWVNLERGEEYRWTVNTHYQARPDAIETLLKTIRRVQVLYPVNKSAYPKVMAEFEKPIKTVEIYTDDPNQPIKKYYLGGTTNTKKGTYMLMEDSKTPYVTYIPGFDGHLTIRYFTIMEEWRDRIIFGYRPEQIQSVSIEYPFTPEHSFTLAQKNGQFGISNTQQTNATPKTVNAQTVQAYLANFRKIYAEAYQNDYPKTDSLRKTQPFAIMKVTDNRGKLNEVVVHYMPVNRRSKLRVDKDGRKIPYDLDRYFAFTHKRKDLMIIQEYVFGKLFKRYGDFIIINN